MSYDKASARINCPVDLFASQEHRIVELSRAINAARTRREKADLARQLIGLVETLLACDAYDATSPDCQPCRQFSTLRLKTARLVIQATRLGDRP